MSFDAKVLADSVSPAGHRLTTIEATFPRFVLAEFTQFGTNLLAVTPGKTQTFGWFVGQVMKKTGGRADPAAVREALTRALDGKT